MADQIPLVYLPFLGKDVLIVDEVFPDGGHAVPHHAGLVCDQVSQSDNEEILVSDCLLFVVVCQTPIAQSSLVPCKHQW